MPESDMVARELSHRAGAVVFAVDYRLAVEGVTYPVPHDDVVAAWRWAVDEAQRLGVEPRRIALGGASAGGNLAAELPCGSGMIATVSSPVACCSPIP
jgi:acetyl esterase/lipase